jgi:hypothetical protein
MKQNWSRRELEAFGETLGDSVTQRKLGGGYICGGGGKGGGGGGGAPAQQTVTQTSIPEYARPYVETMLGKSEALTDINQNPYQAYGGQRIAEFNPNQKQAFQNITNQQVAGQVGVGTGLAGAAGLGSLGAGADYRNMATNPNATAAYMSPYMQNVVDVQKNEALRDAQMRNVGANLGSARQGTYGGARQLLGEQERNRNLQQQMANIQATGSQNAFQAAQQAQQFGTTAGLQGYGQALQGASTLGQLGQTQFGQQQAINQGIQNVGNIQQAQAQQGLDLGYQDFLKQRNYPYQQLAFMSDMARGIPLSQSAQQIYTAPPSAVSQLGGLGMSALGIYGMSGGFKPGAKEGGLMTAKAYKEGGLAYATGGDIKMMSTDQLEALLEKPGLTPLEVGMIEEQLILRRRMEMNPETSQIMAPALRSGIASIGTGEMVPENMAGGGIVAFKEGGTSEETYRSFLEDQVRKSIENQMSGEAFNRSAAEKAKIEKSLKDREENRMYELMARIGAGTAAGTSQYGLSNLGAGLNEGVKSYGQALDRDEANRLKLLEAQLYADKSEDARRSSLTGQMTTSLGQMYGKDAALAAARASAGDPELKLLQKAQALINNNDDIPALIKQRDTYAPGSKEYNAFNTEINAIRNAIFAEVGLKRKPVVTPGVQLPPELEKKGFFSGLFGGSKSEAPAQTKNELVPFNKLPNPS